MNLNHYTVVFGPCIIKMIKKGNDSCERHAIQDPLANGLRHGDHPTTSEN